MSTIFSRMASVYVQTQPGREPVYLGDCVDLDSIPNPRLGGIELAPCWNRRRDGFKFLGKIKSAPGAIEYTLTEILATDASYVLGLHCPFWLYALWAVCGDAGVFDNWDVGAIVGDNDVLSDELTDVAKHAEDGLVTNPISLSGVPPRYDPRPLMASRATTSRAQALNALANCDNLFCGDVCAGMTVPCDNWIAAGDTGVGATGDLTHTHDRGVTWAASTTDPFAINQITAAVVCVQMGRGVTRWLALRATTAAVGLGLAYTDDGGATAWTQVQISATVAEGGTGPKSLFALDWQHIWACSTTGDVYFSSDGGETWTDQNAAGASGGVVLAAISFVDEKIGYVVGATDTIIGTIDGGIHWTAQTATGTGDGLLAVTTFSRYRVLVGTDNATAGGSLWITFDGTANWAERTFVGHATEAVKDMDFWNECIGLIITDEASSLSDKSSIHQSINGGYSWRELPDVPDNNGLNAVVMCDQNEAIAVGEVETGTAVILTISAG